MEQCKKRISLKLRESNKHAFDARPSASWFSPSFAGRLSLIQLKKWWSLQLQKSDHRIWSKKRSLLKQRESNKCVFDAGPSASWFSPSFTGRLSPLISIKNDDPCSYRYLTIEIRARRGYHSNDVRAMSMNLMQCFHVPDSCFSTLDCRLCFVIKNDYLCSYRNLTIEISSKTTQTIDEIDGREEQ